MHIVDPQLAPEAERLIAALAAGRRRAIYRRIAITAAVVLVLVAIVLIWWLTPLRAWLDVHRVVQWLDSFGNSPLAPLALLLAYLIGGVVFVPVNLLIAATVLVFGPWLGILYALIGSVLDAWLLYEIGRRIPASGLRDRIERATQRLRGKLARHGVLAVTLVRIVPVAPYSAVNLAAGALRIPRRDYLLGTAFGMLPGIVFNAVFIDRVVAALEHPNSSSYALLILVAALIVVLAALIRRRVARAHT